MMKKGLLILMTIVVSSVSAMAHGGANFEYSDILKSMKAGDKAAILVVHFGTSYDDTRAKTIDAINAKIKNEFTNFEVREAWSSRLIIKKLAKNGVKKANTSDALRKLIKDGYTHVIVQSTNIMEGVEMESIRREVKALEPRFKDIRVGNPLLYAPEDYADLVNVITKGLNKEETVFFIGHGSYDAGTAQYAMLDYMLKSKGFSNFSISTLEGYPSLADAKNLVKKGTKSIKLIPLMFVAGDHANNDINGDVKEELEEEGYKVSVELKGLGENPEIQNLFVKHLKFVTTHKFQDILVKKANYAGEKEHRH